MITIVRRNLAEIALLDLKGRLIGDEGNTFVATASDQVVEHGVRKMVLNFTGLEQCDSMGISALLRIHASLENMGGKLMICNVNDLITKVFSLTHMDEVLHVYASEEEALEALGVASLVQHEV